MLSQLLEWEGYTVYLAPDGAPALKRLREHPCGMIVLLDMNMPGKDGAEVLREVVADTLLAQRNVFVVMTAQAEFLPFTLTAWLAQLEIPLIAKPFTITEIVDVVAQAAQQLAGSEGQEAS